MNSKVTRCISKGDDDEDENDDDDDIIAKQQTLIALASLHQWLPFLGDTQDGWLLPDLYSSRWNHKATSVSVLSDGLEEEEVVLEVGSIVGPLVETGYKYYYF